jgi:hypothetical protein
LLSNKVIRIFKYIKTIKVMGIKRITAEYAEALIKVSEDQTDTDASYFTLTPSIKGDGWDDVTYYTNRPKDIQIPKGMSGCQWVYVLTNPTMPGLCKIGFTKNKPSDRVKQINSATGVALDFIVEWAFPCFNAHDVEKQVHKYLEKNGFRVNKKKEFFNISVDEAKSVVKQVGEPYKMESLEENYE